ncbi:hypothetical protein [Actinophytocola sp.]|uniref:hypothetical protein n=1 Tax=Actinophytocola sp. TaxID=1872138 RepID=UPI002D7FAC91|nr:hypothetical protein [Actinophytocola sp.]HET9139932.1 hypothetical protein [Actinophytocola sp.]
MKNWSWIKRWPPWIWALAGVFSVCVVVAAVLAWGDGGTETATPGTTTTQPASTSLVATTPVPTTMTQPPTTTATTRRTTPTKVLPGPVPGIVTASAGSAGGSGEVQVEWRAVATATGYRVYRTDSAGRNARLMVDVNILSGRTKAAPEVVNLWSKQHTYIPNKGPLSGPDHSPRFWYVDNGPSDTRCYRVRAYNAAGAGPLSAVTCGTPVIGPPPSIPS